jgi:hypothetical protein
MSLLKDAVAAMKTVLLLEARIASQSKKLEQLAERLVEVERRLAMTEGRLEGFFAGAAAFAGTIGPLSGAGRADLRAGEAIAVSAAPITLDDRSTRQDRKA